ncbi:MAG TPA: DNA-formamidopyrimidine glycosylase family protein [Sumerlaeia bacterium]|nr:DNA-formamidopyrimidine glycosylase family protein [Sumerlaeia bacterium]
MPELPDLQVFTRNLHARLAGRVVKGVKAWRARRRNFTNRQAAEALGGRTLNSIRREGKEALFAFDNGRRLSMHLMLSGRFDLVGDPASVEFARLGIEFDGGEWLVVSDPDGWATFRLDSKPPTAPDALADEFTADYLRASLRRSSCVAVKAFLVDQRILRGIGNAYADEILWASRIAPQSLCDRLPEEKAVELHAAIRTVLTDAIAQIERLAPEAVNGERRDFLKVHHPDRTHSPTGFPIRCETIGLKKTYYSDEQVVFL